jgi:hypothetical protein
MRTRTQRLDARRDVMEGVGDHDVTIVQALMEVCRTIDDASERIAEAYDNTRQAIDQNDDRPSKQEPAWAFR